jgi:hypothetical protein
MSCLAYEQEIGDLARADRPTFSDALAMHLDACASCRADFDSDRVALDASAFECLDAKRRAQLVTALARVRLGRRSIHRAFPVAAVVLAVVAGSIAWHLARPARVPADVLVAALVDDHVRYLGQRARGEGGTGGVLEAELARHVGAPVSLPAAGGATLTGGRRCYLLDRRVALAFYDTPAGQASYFLLPSDALELPADACDAPEPLRCGMGRDFVVVTWAGAGFLHALVGQGRERLLAMADDFSRALDGAGTP